jgi:hypothetical protein
MVEDLNLCVTWKKKRWKGQEEIEGEVILSDRVLKMILMPERSISLLPVQLEEERFFPPLLRWLALHHQADSYRSL